MLRLLVFAGVVGLVSTVAVAAPPQTGPDTEQRFPPLKVPEGFKATLFACDPLIEYPSSIALGPRANTLFVAADYMTGLGTTDIIRRDEIRLVEDTDGDGYADKAPVWADGFNSIQGMTFHDGTVFVMHAPYLTALRDTDGDGVADERKNLFKGFGLGPEDDKVRLHNANGIVAGHDGWLYLALGDRGCDVVRPEGDLLILNGGGILRCRPDGRDLHVFSTGLRNIYDVALDEDLNVFTRDNENDGGNYKIRVIRSFFGADHGYPYLYDERPDEALAPLADLGLGSSAGGIYYKETQFPAEYRGLYFCEWGRAVMRYAPESPGKPFSPMKEVEFASGADNDPYGFKPTDLIVDRDGSLLIADWADGQRPKRGRARIYRVQYVGRTPTSDPKAISAEPQGWAGVPILRLEGWIERLNSESYYERLDAQLAIEKLGRDDPAGVVDTLRRNRNGSERAALHYPWILAHLLGMKAGDELFKLAQFGDSFTRVRTQSIRALADLNDPVLAEHRLDAGSSDASVAKRFASLVHRRNAGAELEVVIALGRLKWAQMPAWLAQNFPLMAPTMAHAAQQALRRCGDWKEVMRLLDGRSVEPPGPLEKRRLRDFTSKLPAKLARDPLPDVPLRTVALRALKDHPETVIVDGLQIRLRNEADSVRRLEYAYVLCRVHRKPPAQWIYWGFRPAPRPANTVDWDRTEVIEQALDRLLADENHDVRFAVLERMQREKIPTRLGTLADWLRVETETDQLAAIFESLRGHPADATRALLESAITDARKPDDSRLTALNLWSASIGEARDERLLVLAKSVDDGAVLADILRELSAREKNSSNADVGSLLLTKAKSTEASVRAAAIESLARLRVAVSAESLPPLLRDTDARVRRAAAFAVGQLKVSSAVPSLLNLARDADVAVRLASLDALRQLREPRVVPLAVAGLAEATTQLSALRCLAEFGGPEHASAVAEVAMRNSSSDVVNLAIQMLSSWSRREELTAERRTELDLSVRELQGASGILAAWEIVGPLPPDAASAVVDFLGDDSQPVKKSDTGTAQWTHLFGVGPESRLHTDGKVQGEWVAFAEFVVSDPATAQFLLSSNAPLRVWLNGKSVLTRAEPRRFQPDSDRCEAKLTKGTNRLVIQFGNMPDAAIEFHARFRLKSSKAEHERLVEAALARPGNVERGRKLFLTVEKSQCLKCHRLGDQGEKIGPELTGIGSRFSRIHIVESLLDPSRTITAGFQTQTLELTDGRVLNGLKISETADSLVLADNQGKKHSLRKADIEDSKANALSIMPEGLEKSLTVDEFVDLISFLTGEKQTAGR